MCAKLAATAADIKVSLLLMHSEATTTHVYVLVASALDRPSKVHVVLRCCACDGVCRVATGDAAQVLTVLRHSLSLDLPLKRILKFFLTVAVALFALLLLVLVDLSRHIRLYACHVHLVDGLLGFLLRLQLMLWLLDFLPHFCAFPIHTVLALCGLLLDA